MAPAPEPIAPQWPIDDEAPRAAYDEPRMCALAAGSRRIEPMSEVIGLDTIAR